MNALLQLTVADVELTIETEAEDVELEGNVLASGDDALDKEAEDELRERLQAGDDSAWCVVIVKASWYSETLERPFVGVASLGCVSLSSTYTLDTCVDEHGLRAEALGSLNSELARVVQDGQLLASELAAEPEPTPLERFSGTFPETTREALGRATDELRAHGWLRTDIRDRNGTFWWTHPALEARRYSLNEAMALEWARQTR